MLELNGVFSLLAALGLSFVVLHPCIHEGLAIKGGMIVMILSLLASASVAFSPSIATAFNAGLALRGGILLVCVGYAIKYRKAKRTGGSTDFGHLTENSQ
jgi:prolipoprotein diacylglyceryltransferase